MSISNRRLGTKGVEVGDQLITNQSVNQVGLFFTQKTSLCIDKDPSFTSSETGKYLIIITSDDYTMRV